MNKSCQNLFGVKLDLIMDLSFLIHNVRLLTFYMDDPEYMNSLDSALVSFAIIPKFYNVIS